MSSWQMPPDINEKEKIVGGILTLSQVGWLGIGVGGCFATVVVMKLMGLGWAGFIFGIPFIVEGIRFAIVKKEDLTLFKYYRIRSSFRKKVKLLPNVRNINVGDVEIIVKKERTTK